MDDEKKRFELPEEIRKIMRYMDILYGIDNPPFVKLKENPSYIFKTVLPWVFKYIFTYPRIQNLNMPVNAYLDTPLPNINQAGQWTYSPSGFPISILSGKLASDKAMNKTSVS